MFTKENKPKKLIRILVPALALSLFAGASSSFAYTVEKGDTLYKIAQKENMSLSDLIALNPQIKDINKIYVGEHINTSKGSSSNTINATKAEKDLLARLVYAEARGESYAGKVAVAYVVLNRVDSPDFPNTINDVIYQKGQFSPVSDGAINNTPCSDSIKAVEEALQADRSKGKGSLFFYNPKTATSHWLDSRPTTIVIGNHVFKK